MLLSILYISIIWINEEKKLFLIDSIYMKVAVGRKSLYQKLYVTMKKLNNYLSLFYLCYLLQFHLFTIYIFAYKKSYKITFSKFL